MKRVAGTMIALVALVTFTLAQAPSTAPSTAPAPVGADGWTVLFRADDPLIWNTDAGDPSKPNGYAVSLKRAPAGVRYLRVARTDSNAAIIVPISRELLSRKGNVAEDYYWNGSTEPRSGGGQTNRLVGLAYKSWNADRPGQHFVHRWTKRPNAGWRGWGFSKAAGPAQDQTYSWGGKPIEKTIFEFAVKSSDLTEAERADLLTPERPPGAEVAATAARIMRRQTSIQGLVVSFDDAGGMMGGTIDLILTATPGPARDNTPVTFSRDVGGQMTAVLDDVLRYVRVTRPKWEASKVDISFDDRTSKMDGASIGAAIGTMIMSMIQGYEIDPNLAMTGDVTADGKVRAIGGVVAKIRAATNSGATIVALPAANYDQVADGLVYEGPALLSGIQIIGVGTLEEAVALAREDRAELLAEAVKLFTEVQEALKKSPNAVRTKAIAEKLAQVIELEPNHYSAKLLSLVAQDKHPRKLSSGASIYYMAVAIRNVLPALEAQVEAKNRVQPVAVKEGLRNLDRLYRIANPSIVPLIDGYRDFIRALSDPNVSVQSLRSKSRAVTDAAAKVNANRALMEKMLREGV